MVSESPQPPAEVPGEVLPETSSADKKELSSTAKAVEYGDLTEPLWFRKEAFLANDFEADVYVNDLRRYVPLTTLRTELDNHLVSLNSELVELINKDYTDFVNLSTKLVDVDGAVLRMRAPLIELQTKLRNVRKDIVRALEAIQSALARRQEAANMRSTLELMLDTANVVAKVEQLLAEFEQLDKSSSGDKTRARVLERIASEVNRLKFYVARGQDLSFVKSMMPRIKNAEGQLSDGLQECLSSALDNKNQLVTLHCLLAYAAMDNVAGAETAVRQVVVAPVVSKLLSSAPESTELRVLYKTLLEGFESQCSFLLDIIKQQHAGIHVFDFVGNALLAEVDAALLESRPVVFSAGVPSTFLTNFRASLEFLEQLEKYCLTRQSLNAFRSSTIMSAFLKRWNTSVYFTLRFQEIAGALDQALGSFTLNKVESKKGGQFAMSATTVVWECLEKCWADEIFLPALSDRFLKLALQLLSRYQGWLVSGISARTAALNSQLSGAGGAPPSTPPPAGVPQKSTAGDWTAGSSAEELAMVRHDAECLADLVEGSYTATVELTLAHLPPPAISGIRDAFSQGAVKLRAVLPDIDALCTTSVVDKCVEVLKQMRGITATYRMTNKPLPTRHSHFVPSILGPLKTFISGDQAHGMSEVAQGKLVRAVAEQVTEKYDGMANDLVNTIRKTEMSLKRLKGRRDTKAAAGAQSGEALSDTDKICHQLLLDVQEYGRQLSQVGVAPESVSSYERLSETVNPTKEGPPTAAQ
eukprot:CAMPEP_0118923858 /NCGR_PEP_ID=MMETSP1169-20130426/2236_1 /TAXON_ID=36882 /ORGANISM="Pyramimonas obovata, Strain CCMP722" /LENGTH=755 /DNA_ID=CAMNT_0006864913 /DNA_START=219 /DNA_END=2486 /DNA_ORIENTATION=-